LDGRFGTSFLVLVGFIFGLTIGVWHLLLMTRAADRRSRPNSDEEDPQ
jgi:hypothetical protein